MDFTVAQHGRLQLPQNQHIADSQQVHQACDCERPEHIADSCPLVEEWERDSIFGNQESRKLELDSLDHQDRQRK